MSTAAAVEGAVPVKAGKKKLIIILVAVLVLLAAAGGGVVYWLKAKAHAAQEAEDAEDDGTEVAHAAAAAPKRDPKAVPVFVPLENFTVNLADREADRYAQIGISLELSDAKAGEKIKLFMPAIRNNILMVLAHKRSSDLLERAGKEKLAEEVLRETERALGLEPAVPGAAKKGDHDDEPRPVRAVHFSNFIIQ
jgi:flagellar FliL protein